MNKLETELRECLAKMIEVVDRIPQRRRGCMLMSTVHLRETSHLIDHARKLVEKREESKTMEKTADGQPIRYLGDGLYAVFYGHGWELRANDPVMPTDVVYLEPEVMRALEEFVKECRVPKPVSVPDSECGQ